MEVSGAIPFVTVLIQFVRSIRASLKDPEFQALFLLVAILLASGTIFYWRMEGWSVLDSLYFSVTTLTTIGYGDLSPSTAASKVFTIFYVFIGIGIIAGFANAIAQRPIARRTERRTARRSRHEREDEHREE